MTKVTLQDKIGAIENVQLQIKIFFEEFAAYEKESVLAEMRRISIQLERRKQTLMHPKPRTPKPAPVASPVDLPTGDYVNTKPKRERK